MDSPPDQAPGRSPPRPAARTWLRFLLYLTPGGALFLGLAVAHYSASIIPEKLTYWAPLTLLCLVTITAGLTDSILKWKGLKGAGTPPVGVLGMDALCFGFAQILFIPFLGLIALALYHFLT